MTHTMFKMYRMEEGALILDEIKKFVEMTRKEGHTPTQVRLNPRHSRPDYNDLPHFPDRYVPFTEVWVGWEKE